MPTVSRRCASASWYLWCRGDRRYTHPRTAKDPARQRGSGAYLWVITETPTSVACPTCPYKRAKIELMRKIPRPIARRILRVIETRRGSGHWTAASTRSDRCLQLYRPEPL